MRSFEFWSLFSIWGLKFRVSKGDTLKVLHFTRWRNRIFILSWLAVVCFVSFPIIERMVFAQRPADTEGIIRAIANEINKEVNEKTGLKNSIYQEAIKAADFWNLKSADEIDLRIETMGRLAHAAENVVAIIRAAPAKAFLKAKGRGLSRQDADYAFETIQSSLEGAKATPIVLKMQTDREWANLHIEVYTLLKKARDKWKPAPENGSIKTEKGGIFVERLIGLTENINKVEDRADALLKQIAK